MKSEYRRHAEQLDAKFHPAGDGTTFKSILNEYGRDGEVHGLVVGYAGEASSDVRASGRGRGDSFGIGHLEFVRTTWSVAKVLHTQRIHREWGHSLIRGFARVILERVRDSLDSVSSHRQANEHDFDAEFNFLFPTFDG